MSEIAYPSAEAIASLGDAAGRSATREGFGFDELHDRLFALGFPHLHWLEEGGPEDEDPAASAVAILSTYRADFRLGWPLETARRWVRLFGGPYLQSGGKPNKKGREVLARDEPLSPEEARGILRFVLKKSGKVRAAFNLEALLLLIEAMVGPVHVAEEVVAALEALPAEAWIRPKPSRVSLAEVAEVVHALGFVLLRAPEERAEALRQRLEALHAARAAEEPRALPVARLDAILHGTDGLERSAERLASGARDPRLYAHGVGDAAVVREAARGYEGSLEDVRLDPRLVFLGGPEVLDVFAESWPRLRGGRAQRYFLATVGEVRDERTVDLVAAMAARSKAKRDARAWLKRRGDFARARLEARAAEGDADAAAALGA